MPGHSSPDPHPGKCDRTGAGPTHYLRRLLPVALCGSLAFQPVSGAERLYRHVGPDGSVTFSDAPQSQLEGGYRTYRGSYGRPAAVASCTGLSSAAIDARAIAFQPAFEQSATDNGLDPLLLQAVARAESCFDPQAVSAVGAQGLMQLMPATARSLGVQDSFDAERNIAGGARYLARMLQRFGNDLKLALAAYNAGPTAVERHGGIPPFKETQRYITRVTAAYERYRQAAGKTP